MGGDCRRRSDGEDDPGGTRGWSETARKAKPCKQERPRRAGNRGRRGEVRPRGLSSAAGDSLRSDRSEPPRVSCSYKVRPRGGWFLS
jgi:hypothetical protein